ncbi:hypothetical protein CRENBAI_024727 [Crenichthys baileyi]|uniref:Uncharacterized protein n=1 Tax=Crenichthys baileyi TaxID=28760 RepID=A0AAV9QXX3_9TELE
MRRPPALSSGRLSTDAGGGFPAHSLAPDQPSPLLPTPNPGGYRMNRLHTPILFLVLFRRGSWMNRLHTPILFLVLFRRGPKPSRPHTLFLSWRAPRMNCLHPWFQFRRSSWRTCLHFLFLSLREARTHPFRLLCLHLAEGPSGLRNAPLSSTMGSPGPAAGCQIIGSYVTGLLNSYVAGLLIACPYVAGLLIAGSARDGLRAGRLNSGSVRDGLQAICLNSCSPLVPYVSLCVILCVCHPVCILPWIIKTHLI